MVALTFEPITCRVFQSYLLNTALFHTQPLVHLDMEMLCTSPIRMETCLCMCEDTLEDLWEGNKSDKPYSAIKKNIELVEANVVPQRVQQLVKFVYTDFLNQH